MQKTTIIDEKLMKSIVNLKKLNKIFLTTHGEKIIRSVLNETKRGKNW